MGLDHFEGRSWRGFHHHAAMVLLAYGFLLLEADRRPAGSPDPGGAGNKGDPDRPLTVPGIRRALQHLLLPVARADCQYCRAHRSPVLTE